jgi:purine-binding chemotaxis protein CheW
MDRVTLYEEDFYESEEIKEESVQLVVFRLADEWYAVDILRIREIVRADKITFLPSSPSNIGGIVNVRGNIVSVTDLKKAFGLVSEDLTGRSRIIVVKNNNYETGILADETDGVIQVSVKSIDPVLSTLSPSKSEYIEGEVRSDNKMIGILHVEKLFDIK